jgi:hypothetical protein
VVDLHDEAGRAVLELRREVDPPQRPATVQRLGENQVRQGVEPVAGEHRAGRREPDHVVPDVEVDVVDPARLGQAPGGDRDPLAETRHRGHAGAHRGAQVRQRDARAVGKRVEDALPAHVHVGAGRLERQEGRVEG